jgi:hypothetical protein
MQRDIGFLRGTQLYAGSSRINVEDCVSGVCLVGDIDGKRGTLQNMVRSVSSNIASSFIELTTTRTNLKGGLLQLLYGDDNSFKQLVDFKPGDYILTTTIPEKVVSVNRWRVAVPLFSITLSAPCNYYVKDFVVWNN